MRGGDLDGAVGDVARGDLIGHGVGQPRVSGAEREDAIDGGGCEALAGLLGVLGEQLADLVARERSESGCLGADVERRGGAEPRNRAALGLRECVVAHRP